FDLEEEDLVGSSLGVLLDRIDSLDDLPRDGDVERAEFEICRNGTRYLLVLVPARAADGRADEVVAMLGVAPTP
ncbi:MAG: hypothetical protein ACKO04_10280, partial [Actinomycetes bacterium]